MSDQQVKATFGTPVKTQVVEGATNFRYKDMNFTFAPSYKRISFCETNGKRLSVLADLVTGGIKVGDKLAKLEKVNFSKTKYGRNKAGNNLKEIKREQDKMEFLFGTANYVIFDEEFEKIYLCVVNGTIKSWTYFKMGDAPYENYDFSNRLIDK